MTWHVRYRNHAGDHVVRHSTPEEAIETACRLIDDGYDVYGIGTGSLADSIDLIACIDDIWVRPRLPFPRN